MLKVSILPLGRKMKSTLRLPVLSWAESKLVMVLDATPRQRRTAAGGEKKVHGRLFLFDGLSTIRPFE